MLLLLWVDDHKDCHAFCHFVGMFLVITVSFQNRRVSRIRSSESQSCHNKLVVVSIPSCVSCIHLPVLKVANERAKTIPFLKARCNVVICKFLEDPQQSSLSSFSTSLVCHGIKTSTSSNLGRCIPRPILH